MTVDTFREYQLLTRAVAAAYKFTPNLTVKEFVDSMSKDTKFYGVWNAVASTIHLRGKAGTRRRGGSRKGQTEDGFQVALRLWDLEPITLNEGGKNEQNS